eukprot:Skav207649  [mRNA]  locus=scaffold2758:62206:63370:- [translate_table: standard]
MQIKAMLFTHVLLAIDATGTVEKAAGLKHIAAWFLPSAGCNHIAAWFLPVAIGATATVERLAAHKHIDGGLLPRAFEAAGTAESVAGHLGCRHVLRHVLLTWHGSLCTSAGRKHIAAWFLPSANATGTVVRAARCQHIAAWFP